MDKAKTMIRKGASVEEKDRWLQVRMTADEKRMLDELASDYRLDMSAFIREAIRYMDYERPVMAIRPRMKDDVENASH